MFQGYLPQKQHPVQILPLSITTIMSILPWMWNGSKSHMQLEG